MRKIFTILVLALAINAFAQVPTNGLVAYYPFNGNANDASGNGNNGIVNGATLTNDRFGNPNCAYSFNANTAITVNGTPSLNPSTMGSYSLSVWVYINPNTIGDPRIVWAGPQTCSLDFLYRKATLKALFSNDGCGSYTLSNNTNLNQNLWYHLVYTLDFNSNVTAIYLNGIQDGSINYTTIIPNSSLLTISGWPQGQGAGWNGLLDDIRIYNRVLSQSEVTAIYNENICYQTITVTDTLIINVSFTGFNPITYENTIKVYPNPTNDHITIDFGSNFATMNGYTLKITNSLSQVVYTTQVNQQITTVDLSTWSGTGIYFVHLIDEQSNTIDIRKIILQ
jgi:hypothetical protein